MHIIDCPDCVNGWQWTGRMDQPTKVICIECDGTGEIEVEDEIPDVEDIDTTWFC